VGVDGPLAGLTINTQNSLTLRSATVNGAIRVTTLGLWNQTGSVLTSAAAGDAIVLSTSTLLNDGLTGALSAPNGRWLVYMADPATSTEGGLAGVAGSALPRLYNRTYAANGPSTISETGNHLIYASQPTINVTANAASRNYGDANPALTYAASGFVVDDGFTDTLAGVGFAGALATAAVPTSPVSGSPYSIGSGTLASSAGYSILLTTGSLTVNPRPLTIAADNKSKPQGDPNPPLTATYAGFASGESATNLTGTLSLSTPATTGSPAGNYAITPSGQSSGNYAISFVNGTLVVNGTPVVMSAPPIASSGVDEQVRVAIVDADRERGERRGNDERSEPQNIYRLVDDGIKMPEGER
jgi:hypothetical protein